MHCLRCLSILLVLALFGCGGNAVERSSASSSSSSSASSSSSTSSSSSSSSSTSGLTEVTTTIEEEDRAFCPFSGSVENIHAGFNGSGYANGVNASGIKLSWALSVRQSGNYPITIRYANGGTAARPALLSSSTQSAALSFATTGLWSDWQTEQTTFYLSEGMHLINLEASGVEGLANIDSISLRGIAPVDPGLCPAQSPLTIWIAGDSTVANGNTPCPVGWGKTIGTYFNDKVSVQNSAVGGRSVRTWLYDVQDQMGNDGECRISTHGDGSPVLQSRWTNMLTQMKAGDYLFIQFGINDGAATCPRHVGGAAFQNEYAYMANEAIKRGVHPILITPAPAVKCSGSTAVGSRGFIRETFAVGNQLNIPVLDLHQLGTDLYNQLAFCPVAGGDVSSSTTGPVGEFFCDDHTHFDTPGAQKISRIIINELRAQGIPLAEYLLENQ